MSSNLFQKVWEVAGNFRRRLLTPESIPGWFFTLQLIWRWLYRAIDGLSNADWVFSVLRSKAVNVIWQWLLSPIGTLLTMLAGIAWLTFIALRKPVVPNREIKRTMPPQETGSSVSIQELPCPYEWLHELANTQARAIRDFVEVVRVGTWNTDIDDALPRIKWGVLVNNRSVFPVGLDGEVVGDLFFQGHRLAEKKLISSNELSNLGPGQQGQLVFEQRLSGPEVALIKNSPEGRFQFHDLRIKIKSNRQEPNVESQQLLISSELHPKLGEMRDKDSRERDGLKSRIDLLQSQLEEAVSARLLGPGLPEGQLIITNAVYGAGDEVKDVAAILTSMIVDGHLSIKGEYNTIFKMHPARGLHKYLRIVYLHNSQEFSIKVPENTEVTLPIPYVTK